MLGTWFTPGIIEGTHINDRKEPVSNGRSVSMYYLYWPVVPVDFSFTLTIQILVLSRCSKDFITG